MLTLHQPLTHQCLHHAGSLLPDIGQTLFNVDHLRHALHQVVQYDEGPRPPHPRTAVDQQRGAVPPVLVAHTLDELEERGGVMRYAVIRPPEELEV